MTHPSIQGLREAVAGALARCHCRPPVGTTRCPRHGTTEAAANAALDAQAAYLTEHGVGWFGEGLVRAEEVGVETPDGDLLPFDVESRPGGTRPVAILVPVPQDGEGVSIGDPAVRKCNARNREWHACELVDHAEGAHWSLAAGSWSETLTLSGDSRHVYLVDETGRIVAQRPVPQDGET